MVFRNVGSKCFERWKNKTLIDLYWTFWKGAASALRRVTWLSQSFGAVLLGYSHSLSNHFHLQHGDAENSSQIKRAEAQIGSQISRLSRISAVQPSRAAVRGGEMISWHFHNLIITCLAGAAANWAGWTWGFQNSVTFFGINDSFLNIFDTGDNDLHSNGKVLDAPASIICSQEEK